MAYLVRRLLGKYIPIRVFYDLTYHEGTGFENFISQTESIPEKNQSLLDIKRGDIHSPFVNCPLTDFTD